MEIESTTPSENQTGFTIVERGIALFSPRTALNRAKSRILAQEMFRAYDMAGRGRRTKGWRALGNSANGETATSLTLMRNRSRDLTRNNSYGKRAIQAIATNVVGSGIRPRPILKNKTTESAYKDVWDEWANSINCDFDGQGNFYSLQHLAMRCIAESGEVLIRRRRVRGMAIPFQIQVLEPDFLDQSKDTKISTDGNYSIQGVEFDKSGKRIGYWLFSSHPGEGSVMQSQFVPASEVLHVYYKERPGQVRGVPFGASSAVSLYDFEEYEQAQLIRQKIAACMAVFIEDPTSDASVQPANKNQKLTRVEPGMIQRLAPGEKITVTNPPSVQNYNEYVTALLRKCAVGFGVTYEVISGDLSNVNFSSGRMGWIEMGRLITAWQTLMLVPMMCDPIWNWFTEAAMVAGKVNRKNVKAGWTPPRREMIDPIKEINGMSKAIRSGLHSWSDTVRQLGQDPDEVLDEIIAERKKFEKNNIILECDPTSDPARITAQAALESAENDDETDDGEPSTKKQNEDQ